MTEVEICGGGHRTRLRQLSTCVSMGCPPPLYIKEWRRERAGPLWRAQGGSPTPTRSRTPPSLVGVGEERKREKERRKGGRPPRPKPIRFGPRGAHPTAPLLPSTSTK